MSINYEYLVYGAIFVAVFLFVEGIYLAAFGRSIKLNSRVSRRLDLLQKTGGSREQVLEQLQPLPSSVVLLPLPQHYLEQFWHLAWLSLQL